MSDSTTRQAFGNVLTGRLTDLAADFRRIADALDALASEAPKVLGATQGVADRPTAGTDMAARAARLIHRDTPSLACLVLAAGDYDRYVTNFEGGAR